MNIKKMLIATIASFIVMMGLGGLVHMVLLKNWYIEHMGAIGNINRAEPMVQYIALGTLILALIMSYMYPKGVESDNKVTEGLKFGVIMGILFIVPFSVILYGATTVFSGKVILMDAALHSVIQGLGGITIAFVYGNEVRK